MPELVVVLRDRELQRHKIYGVATTVGRDPTNDLVLDNMGVSRQHFRVVVEGENFFVEDASSANGVFVNGVPTRKQRLYDGDRIQVGKFVIVFSARGGADAAKLSRNAMLPQDAKAPAAVLDPEATMALAPADIAKFIVSSGHAPGGGGAPPGRGLTPAQPAQLNQGYGADHEAVQSPHARVGAAAQNRVRGASKRVATSPRSKSSSRARPVARQMLARAANLENHDFLQPENEYVEGYHQQAQQAPQPAPSPVPIRYADEQPPSRLGTVFGNANQAAYLEQQASTFRNLAIVLGVAVVSLMGLTLALVLIG